jgi:hypothetical protein
VKQIFRISNWGVNPSAIITRSGNQRFSWPLKYALNGSNFMSDESIKEEAHERILPKNFYLSGTLEAVCTMQGRGGTTMKINGTVLHPFLP